MKETGSCKLEKKPLAGCLLVIPVLAEVNAEIFPWNRIRLLCFKKDPPKAEDWPSAAAFRSVPQFLRRDDSLSSPFEKWPCSTCLAFTNRGALEAISWQGEPEFPPMNV